MSVAGEKLCVGVGSCTRDVVSDYTTWWWEARKHHLQLHFVYCSSPYCPYSPLSLCKQVDSATNTTSENSTETDNSTSLTPAMITETLSARFNSDSASGVVYTQVILLCAYMEFYLNSISIVNLLSTHKLCKLYICIQLFLLYVVHTNSSLRAVYLILY